MASHSLRDNAAEHFHFNSRAIMAWYTVGGMELMYDELVDLKGYLDMTVCDSEHAKSI